LKEKKKGKVKSWKKGEKEKEAIFSFPLSLSNKGQGGLSSKKGREGGGLPNFKGGTLTNFPSGPRKKRGEGVALHHSSRRREEKGKKRDCRIPFLPATKLGLVEGKGKPAGGKEGALQVRERKGGWGETATISPPYVMAEVDPRGGMA